MVEKLKLSFKKLFSNGPKAIFILLLIVMGFAITYFGAKKTITVVVNGYETKVQTFAKTYKKALNENNIVVGPKDKTSVSLDSKVENNSKIFIKRVTADDSVDGKQVAANNVKSKEIAANETGVTNPSIDTVLEEGLKVDIKKVNSKTLTEVKPVDFSTVVKKDSSIEQGTSKTVQEGKAGEKEVVVKVIYEDGKEVSREVVSEAIKSKPVDKIVAQGTMKTYALSRGDQFSYDSVLRMKATAYDPSTSGSRKTPGYEDKEITASGTIAKRNSEGYSTVAVDPRVIPLGTKLYIEGYGYAIAEDTGGAIKGNRIDLYFNNTSEVYDWGVRNVNVYILR